MLYSVEISCPTYSRGSFDFSAHFGIIKYYSKSQAESKFRNLNALRYSTLILTQLKPACRGDMGSLPAPPSGALLSSSPTLFIYLFILFFLLAALSWFFTASLRPSLVVERGLWSLQAVSLWYRGLVTLQHVES